MTTMTAETGATCIAPSILGDFSSYFRGEAQTSIYALAGTDDPVSCSTSLAGQAKIDCASFTTWTQYTAAFAGVLGTAANVVAKFVHEKKIARDIIIGLHALYAAVQGINLQFLQAIQDIDKGTTYAPIPQPDPIPPFPDPKPGSEIGQAVESAWAIFEPFLEKMIAKMPGGSPWIKVLEGVITSSQQVIDQLKKLFNEIANG